MTRVTWIALGALVLGGAGAAGAQQSRCDLIGGPNTHTTADTVGGGRSFWSGGINVRCPSRQITLIGDSAEVYPNRYYVVGHVKFTDPRLSETSDFLNYFPQEERVVAAGNVHATLPNGSTMVGPVAEYLRPLPPSRPREQVRAQGRPTITIAQKDSLGRPMPPTTVVATTVFMDGDSLIYGSGAVEITHDAELANADSAFIDETHDVMHLIRNPILQGKKDRPFTLTADLIDMYSKNQKLSRVLARAKAKAVSDSMTLTADTIDLRVDNDLLDHAYAWGATTHPRAVSPGQTLTADSLDVSMPEQHLQLVHAVREALAQGRPDTVRFHVQPPDTVDWLSGDTIVARFDTAATHDTSKAPVIRQLVAHGHAAAWYHMAPTDTGEQRPAINQVSAGEITIDFNGKHKVGTVTARDSVVGIYVEPQPDSTAKKAAANAAPPGQKPPPQQPAKTPPVKPPAPTTPVKKPPQNAPNPPESAPLPPKDP